MDPNINSNPLVSVTICTYNRANFILDAIKSIENQTYKNIEIIVVDDASTDSTEEVIKNYECSLPLKYFKNEENLNIAGTRNETIKYSSGEFIAILDSDDYWIDVNKIQKQVEFLEKNKEFALVGTQAKKIDLQNNEIGSIKNFLSNEDIKKNILIRNQFIHSSVLYRKSAIIENKLFDKNKSPFEDYDLILKIGRKYKMANLDIESLAYRVHAGSESLKLNFIKKIKLVQILLKNSFYYPNFYTRIKRGLLLHFK